MNISPLDLEPPDNTGSDTLRRYRYQAQLVVPFCLDCATNGKVVSVVAEHFEDVLIQYEDKWQFIQIKTRNQNMGPWRLTHALDGLKSLFRTYQAINPIKALKASYSLYLEGAVHKDDPLNALAPDGNGKSSAINTPNPELLERLMNGLQIEETLCHDFVENVVVLANQPTRQDIDNRNIRLLSQIAANSNSVEVEAGYERLVSHILEAMAGTAIKDGLLEFLINPSTPSAFSKVQHKIITKENLINLLGSLATGPNLLLRRLVMPNMSRPTNLEMKLLAAGADPKIIADAKMLHANATVREAELLAANYDSSRLDDVRDRLGVLSNSIVQLYRNTPNPAVRTYHDTLMAILANPGNYDLNRIFKQDPYFLMGVVCGLADECRIDWGVPLA